MSYDQFRILTDAYEHREDDPHYDMKRERDQILARSSREADEIDRFNPNLEINNRVEWGEDWINEIMQADRDKRAGKVYFKTLYTALSCVGARIGTWYELINFDDCENFSHDVRKLPVRWKKAGTPPKFHQTYRIIDYKTGCWNRYGLLDTHEKIVEYLKDAVSNDILDPVLGRNNTIAVGRSGDGWYIDQALVSIRIGQWGKRRGYERIRQTNIVLKIGNGT